MNNYDFQDQTVIVTGGGQGIGFSVAKRILEGGGKVAVGDVDQELLNSLIENLGGNAANILAQDVDISDTLAVQVASDTVHSTFGKIDILINRFKLIIYDKNSFNCHTINFNI